MKRALMFLCLMTAVVSSSCMNKSSEMCSSAQKTVVKLSAMALPVQSLFLGVLDPSLLKTVNIDTPATKIEKYIKFEKVLKSQKGEDGIYYCRALISLKKNNQDKRNFLVDYTVEDEGGGYISVRLSSLDEVQK